MVVKDIFGIIKKIREESMASILLVEQNAKMTFWISDRCFILENGVTVLHGSSESLRNDPRVKDIYLGVS
jgi:branched-chain amino acid transport system ATP-binding protein